MRSPVGLVTALQRLRLPVRNVVAALALFAVAVLIGVDALRLQSNTATVSAREAAGAAQWMWLVVIGLMLAGLAELLLVRPAPARAADPARSDDGREFQQVGRAWLMLAAYVALVPILGYTVSTALFFVTYLHLSSSYGLRKALLYGLGIALVIYLLFVALAGLHLPTGLLATSSTRLAPGRSIG